MSLYLGEQRFEVAHANSTRLVNARKHPRPHLEVGGDKGGSRKVEEVEDVCEDVPTQVYVKRVCVYNSVQIQ